ncbi:MAG TPA: DUF502 domain-containing protein [Thermoanaerobaculia bacterium]|nr:DUF502 domain-containing protein [Thermoanaerobaculia bacterium]
MNRILRYFFQGLLIVIPVSVTVWVLYQVFVWIDTLVVLPVPGAGFLIMVGAIFLIGFLASNFVGRRVFALVETLFIRAPIVRIVYLSIRDLLEAFVGERRRFTEPVMVRFEGLGDARAVGFVTRDALPFRSLEGHVAVYFPQSYNFAGNLLLVPRTSVTVLETDSAETMAFVVSGGVSGLK